LGSFAPADFYCPAPAQPENWEGDLRLRSWQSTQHHAAEHDKNASDQDAKGNFFLVQACRASRLHGLPDRLVSDMS